MSKENQIQLKTTCVLNLPFKIYDKDFIFLVNNEEFQTNHVISELLSPKICEYRINDPNMNIFKIDTTNSGDFSHILDLITFEQVSISDSEIPFLEEVLCILGNESIDITTISEKYERSKDNIFELTRKHERYESLYSKSLTEDIEYIASHFYELCCSSSSIDEFQKLKIDTIYRILGDSKLRLKNEDQLVSFINEMYRNQAEYSILYEHVLFCNCESASMKEFTKLFEIENMTTETWNKLCVRLDMEVEIANKEEINKIKSGRYEEEQPRGQFFKSGEDDNFDGIINHILKEKGNVDVTSLTHHGTLVPSNVIVYGDESKWYCSLNQEGNWICFHFREHKIIPTSYKLKSSKYGTNSHNPKTWVIEGSNDKSSWENLGGETDSPFLNGSHLVHLFTIKNDEHKEFNYIRMRLTAPNWENYNFFMLDSFEIYGQLI